MNELSHEFMDAFTMCGTTSADCEFCKTTHFTHEDIDAEELRDKEKAEPTKYRESDDDGLAFGHIDGRQYVYGCQCAGPRKYEEFIWRYREQITAYLRNRAKRELDEAKRNLEIVS